MSRRPARRLMGLVLALHLALGWFVFEATKPQQRGASVIAAAAVWLRLLPDPAPPPAPTRPNTARARESGRPPQAPAFPAAAHTAPEAITLPAEPTVAAAQPASAPASAPLDLRWRPGSSRTPAALARDDARIHAPVSSDERLARALGTDQTLHESALPDGSRTFRRGRDCVIARPARNAELDPMSQGARPTPRLIDRC
ncbi:hypothetical protein HLB44_11570 [Aquincola sp. S2]|uniref:Uncharacterized protein n=1 Tax=Pseudaquabacterium terrae TaxID=2732868 RepID=A0ABX2EG79_9BURK|nr:hypothetical protein [Aquabacterium terrae]NRF67624.1 hypothetical protein [Aquabacterium terrae]